MRTLETQQFQTETNPDLNKKIKTMSNKISEELANIFGLQESDIKKITFNEKNNVINLTSAETNELSNENEVNIMELQLAKMFGKDNEMKNLNLKSYSEPYSPLGDMTAFEEEFKMAA